MEKLVIVLTVCLITGCGVDQTTYNRVLAQKDSLEAVNTKLMDDIEEMKNGESRLVSLADNSYNEGRFTEAQNHINQLLEKHPESVHIARFKKLLPEIQAKLKEEMAIIEQKRNDSIRLANINNLGTWTIGHFVDDFGQKTGEGYITTSIYGNFSNTAVENADLKVEFIISDKRNVAFQLYEYLRSNPVKGYNDRYKIFVLDSKQQKHELYATNNRSDRLTLDSWSRSGFKSDSEKLHDILLEGGEIKFVVKETGSLTEYKFTIPNADWYGNAYLKLKGITSK